MTKLYRLLRITPTSLVCSCFLLASSLSQADQANPYDQAADWTRSVQLSATVQESPPQITLSWDPDEYGSTNYLIYRKSQSSTSWGAPIASLDGSALSYSDPNVSVGSTYEYQVIEKNATYGYSSYGYIYSGIDANLIESRGALILIVATNSTAGLDSELAQYESDLIGDGWQVIRHDVSSSDSPASVRSLIVADYNADPAHVNAVFLFGHVPILQSGEINYDGHGDRPMPADGYYGDMDGDWSSSPSYFPSEIKLMVGRVDFANMPATAAPGTWPDETQLLGNYLKKDHRWRFGQITVPRRALIAERFGILNGIECRASSGYRNLAPFVGLGNTELADISNDADPANRWISKLSSGAYLWTYGNGGGQDSSISELGTHGIFNDVWSTDLYSQDAKAVFFMLEGSHFGNWDHSDDIVRAVLAMPTMGLICCNIAGHPQWYCHHMGLGEPIGYSVRLTMNNTTLYQDTTNEFARVVYIALMGDPTLRMDPVAPPSAVTAQSSSGVVKLAWARSSGNVLGYHVYRSSSAGGPFTRITASVVGGNSYQDNTAPQGENYYMVRAIALETNPSGSYEDPSQGAFAEVNNTGNGSGDGGGGDGGGGNGGGDTNPPPSSLALPGVYTGLFSQPDQITQDTSGSFTITLNSRGRFSGRIRLAGRNYPFSGVIDSDAAATCVVKKAKPSPLTVSLVFGIDADAGTLSGTVTDGDWMADLSGSLEIYSKKRNPAPQAGSYTLVFPAAGSNSDEPSGTGYATVKIMTSGVARLSGTLADGTKFSQSAALDSNGNCPINIPLYARKGSLFGEVTFISGATAGAGGDLTWMRPAIPKAKLYPDGFMEEISVQGSPYRRVKNAADLLGSSAAQIGFSGDSISSFSEDLTFGPGSKVRDAGRVVRMSFSLATGRFSGRANDPDGGKPLTFSGVVLENAQTGAGFFSDQTRAGAVVLNPE